MDFAKIIVAVAYFLQVYFSEVNGQAYNPNFLANSLTESEKGSLQSVADNANFRANYINFAVNHLSQSKLSQNRLSDFFNQKAALPIENYQKNMFAPNLRQQSNAETQDVPNVSNFWNIRQDPNRGNNIKSSPSNVLASKSHISPAPNIALVTTAAIPSTQSIVPPSLSISTSLPSFIPKASIASNYIKLQPRNQVSHDTNPNQVFALAETAKAPTNTNSGNYYYVSQPPSADINDHKSLNMKMLLPLILNLLNDKNEDCPCCSHCQRCSNKDNLAEVPLIDSGYSKHRIYGSPSEESYEDSESEEKNNYVEKKNVKHHSHRSKKRQRHNHLDEGKESRSNED